MGMFFHNEKRSNGLKRQGLEQFKKTSVQAALTFPERTYELFNDLELIQASKEFALTGKRHEMIFDIECYRNYFLIGFKSVTLGKVVYFEMSPDNPTLNVNKLGWMAFTFCLIGFFSKNFDIPMMCYAMAGANTKQLKELCNDLIMKDENNRSMYADAAAEKYGFIIPELDHIDLINVAPLDGSLKLYAGRMHCQRMQDLPYEPHVTLTREQAGEVRLYCLVGDLVNTRMLYLELLPYIKLREKQGAIYGEDFRSKSDAQMAEAIFVKEIERITGKKPKRPTIPPGTIFKFPIPEHISYVTPQLQRILEDVRKADFVVADSSVKAFDMPPELDKRKVYFPNNLTITMGLGGLHSTEESVAHYATEDEEIIDIDVDSFYPWEILLRGLFPEHIGLPFLTVYKKIVDTRLFAKAEVGKIKAHLKLNPMTEAIRFALEEEYGPQNDGLKIAINGSFGKLGSKWSAIFAPLLMIQVTVGCQLNLLMLVEALALANFNVLSVNTDGIVSKVPKVRNKEFQAIVAAWKKRTGFTMEETKYKATFNRDVNNYIILKEDGTTKVKGAYAEKGSALNSFLSKNPETLICSEAIQEMIKKGTPFEETIKACKDIRKFVSILKVDGGAVKDGEYLGKVIRWYYAKGTYGAIHRMGNGNKVPMTDGARPLMDLPLEFPSDMDYDWYVNEANRMAQQCGYFQKPQSESLF